MDAARAHLGDSPHWIVAKTQTKGRGRQGRSWLAAEGSFAATLSLPLPKGTSAPQAALRSFVAAVALYDALKVYVPAQSLAHKWPNDVLLDGGKVAGILLETVLKGTDIDRLLIGIGVNLGPAPHIEDRTDFAPKGLGDVLAIPPTATDFLPILAHAFQTHETAFRTEGFTPIKAAWMSHATRLGQTITARTGQGEYMGRFEGIDNNGSLLILTAQGPKSISAADVYF